jgi:hypothetical protein
MGMVFRYPVARVSMEKENHSRDRWLSRYEEERLFIVASQWLKDIVVLWMGDIEKCGIDEVFFEIAMHF